MLLSAVSVLVVAHSSSEIPEGLMNNPVFTVSYQAFMNSKAFHETLADTREFDMSEPTSDV